MAMEAKLRQCQACSKHWVTVTHPTRLPGPEGLKHPNQVSVHAHALKNVRMMRRFNTRQFSYPSIKDKNRYEKKGLQGLTHESLT